MSFAVLTAFGEVQRQSQRNLMAHVDGGHLPKAPHHHKLEHQGSQKKSPPFGPRSTDPSLGSPPVMGNLGSPPHSAQEGSFRRSGSLPPILGNTQHTHGGGYHSTPLPNNNCYPEESMRTSRTSSAIASTIAPRSSELRIKLAELLANEQFEEAALVRDRIRALGDSAKLLVVEGCPDNPRVTFTSRTASSSDQTRPQYGNDRTPSPRRSVEIHYMGSPGARGAQYHTTHSRTQSSPVRGVSGDHRQSDHPHTVPIQRTGTVSTNQHHGAHHHPHSLPLPDRINLIDNHPPSSVCSIM